MKRLGVFILVVSLVSGLLVFPAVANVVWNANSVWPLKNHHTVGLMEFAKKVKERTHGKLEIIVQPGGALGFKGPELLKAVRDGLVPLSDMLMSGVAGDEPVFGVSTLPFLFRNYKDSQLLSRKIGRPYFDKAARKWNQLILYIAPWPFAGLWTKRPIKSVADMKGLKTRTYDKNGALVVKYTGGTPHALPFSEVYSALATGLVDSVITSTPTAVDAKFWEVLKYFQRLNIEQAVDMVNVNLDAFNKLDKETQKILIETGKEMENIMWSRVQKIDREKEEVCIKHGMVSVPVSSKFIEELIKVTHKIRADWLKSAPLDAKKLYLQFVTAVGR